MISFSAQASSSLSTTVILHLLSVNSCFFFFFFSLLDFETIFREYSLWEGRVSWTSPSLDSDLEELETAETTVLSPAFLPFFCFFNAFQFTFLLLGVKLYSFSFVYVSFDYLFSENCLSIYFCPFPFGLFTIWFIFNWRIIALQF